MMRSTSVLMGLVAFIPALSMAQVSPPDAGQTLQQQGPRVDPAPSQSTPLLFNLPKLTSQVPPGGSTVQILQIRFEGNQSITGENLLSALGPDRLTKPLDLSQIQGLAQSLTQYYQSMGYPFARVFVPEQSMEEGNLTLLVVEGQYGSINVIGEDSKAQAVSELVDQIKPGQVITSSGLERQVLLLNDLPGVAVLPRIGPGKEIGQGDLDLNVSLTPGVTGTVSADNYGNRFTGEYRANASLRYNSPFMLGDQMTFDGTLSDEGLLLGALGYSLPVGASGTRLNASVSHTYYELGKEFSNLQAQGTANTLSVGLSYPYLRSQAANFRLAVNYQYKNLNDKQNLNGVDNSKYSRSVPLSASFDSSDSVLGARGVTFGSVSYTLGELDLDAVLLATDQNTARTDGSFRKLNMNLARIQSLSSQLSLSVRASYQWANKNLDSSEGFGIGGANGVRAYPSGEGFGDEGWLAQSELRYQLNRNFAPYFFYDVGRVRTNAKPFGNAANNTRLLSGAGLGLKFYAENWFSDVFVAWINQGGDPQSDSKKRNPRIWFSVGYSF